MTWTRDALRPLVERWDERARGGVSRFRGLPPEAAARGSVLRDPATEEQIAAAEERLSVQLPPSYRAFLQVSNGAYASTLGAEEGCTRHGFLGVQDVAYAEDADANLVELWTGEDALNDPANDRRPLPGRGSDVAYYGPMRHALLVSRPHETFRNLLVPREGEEEWELWAFAKEGAIAYRSFADFLLVELTRAWWPGPDPRRADEYVALVRAGRLYYLSELAELADPRVADLACEMLTQEHPPAAWEWDEREWERTRALQAARTLGLLAEQAFGPVLRCAYDAATTMDMRRATLLALAKCRAPGTPELLASAAENDHDDRVRLAAVRALAEHAGLDASHVLDRVAQNDPEERVRELAAYLRGRRGSELRAK